MSKLLKEQWDRLTFGKGNRSINESFEEDEEQTNFFDDRDHNSVAHKIAYELIGYLEVNGIPASDSQDMDEFIEGIVSPMINNLKSGMYDQEIYER